MYNIIRLLILVFYKKQKNCPNGSQPLGRPETIGGVEKIENKKWCYIHFSGLFSHLKIWVKCWIIVPSWASNSDLNESV